MTRIPIELGPSAPAAAALNLLPFRFHRLADGAVFLSNIVGEGVTVSSLDFARLMDGTLDDPALVRRLRGKHILAVPGEQIPLDLLAMKLRTRNRSLIEFTRLHMFVVTLRCDHSCPYCQVSRKNIGRADFDMTEETADRAIDLLFRSPASGIKVEFQGGEPLLNLPLIEYITERSLRLNEAHGKALTFVIATNLALIDDRAIDYARRTGAHFSTSIDGPMALHNANRPRPDADSWQRAVAGIERVREELGPGRVSALMTTTERSLRCPEAIIDAYVDLGFDEIFLRPISPYGFAMKTRSHKAYNTTRWLEFYQAGLNHIIALNARGVSIREHYAAIILRKMLTDSDPGYIDLQSPAGIGIGGIVYNYDGDVYASDEARMLAEMGDTTFRIGNVHRDSYSEIMTAEPLLAALDESFAASAPMCSDCAFECYCGADPVFHHATSGDVLGRKPTSAFCQRNMGIFEMILERQRSDPYARRLFRSWASG